MNGIEAWVYCMSKKSPSGNEVELMMIPSYSNGKHVLHLVPNREQPVAKRGPDQRLWPLCLAFASVYVNFFRVLPNWWKTRWIRGWRPLLHAIDANRRPVDLGIRMWHFGLEFWQIYQFHGKMIHGEIFHGIRPLLDVIGWDDKNAKNKPKSHWK